MQQVIEKLALKLFIGIEVCVCNSDGSAAKEIPLLWQKFIQEDIHTKIPNKASDDIISLYTHYQGDWTQPYTTLIGCEVTSLDSIPEGMVGKAIPASSYALFPVNGPKPQAVFETWLDIWKGDFNRAYVGDFEVYRQTNDPYNPDVTIYLSVLD